MRTSRLSRFSTLALLLAVLAPACRRKPPLRLTARDLQRTITFGGLERNYIIHMPEGKRTGEDLPLVFVLHGGGGTAEGAIRLDKGLFQLLSDASDFYLVYPSGFKKHWNDGRVGARSEAAEKNVNDVGFIDKIIQVESSRLLVDPNRIFAAGMSNGAMMLLRLACDLSTKIKAVAAVTGSMHENMLRDCVPERPVSVLFINGTEDSLVPYEGGDIKVLWRSRGKVISTRESIQFWLLKNSYNDDTGKVVNMPDTDPDDGTMIKRYTYGPCKNDTRIQLYEVTGGGHTWPGGWQYLGKALVGRTSRDINASEAIWNFFRGLP